MTLKIPCMTLRRTTERPGSVSKRSNQLGATDPRKTICVAQKVLAMNEVAGSVARPALWCLKVMDWIFANRKSFLHCSKDIER